jgi:hypothetical protein
MPEELLTRMLQASAKVIQQVKSWEIYPENVITRMPPKVVAKVVADGVAYRVTVQEWIDKEPEEDPISKRF